MYRGGQEAAGGGADNIVGFTSDAVQLPVGASRSTNAEALANSPALVRFPHATRVPATAARLPGPAAEAAAGAERPAAAGGERSGWLRNLQIRLVASDLVAAAIASYVAYLVRFMLVDGTTSNRSYLLFGPLLIVCWICVVALNRAYEARFLGVGPDEFQRVFRAFLYLVVTVSFVSYATKAEIARGFVLVALPLTLIISFGGRYVARKSLHRWRRQGQGLSRAIVVGGADSITTLAAMLRRDSHAGMNVVGACVPSESAADPQVIATLSEAGIPLLGDIDFLREAVDQVGASTVAVTSSAEIGADRLRWVSWQLEGSDTDLVVSPGLIEVAGSRLHVRPVSGLPLLHVELPEFTGLRRVLKDAFDRLLAGLALLVLAPLFLVLMIAVRRDSRGPVFFKQIRVGRGGRTFQMIKFRSMHADAESMLDDLRSRNESDGLLFKIRGDPRVTRVGRFLRRTSLDELPQLINVFKGSMSLVGPRPPLQSEVERYSDDVRRRLLVKPGVTGLWQVSGRSNLSWEESVRLDLRYVENWTPALDLVILCRTFAAVVRRAGAY